ncbi:MAG: cobalamin biosynthesis protein CobG [Alphaproteobacteria bacterium]|nr:cobalamin biosynthesis protein CobG [Alphaproteobacteria bacterium]MCB9931759.1 cobalamin biosynthesis protein CobG [Alphaproteobacteria bacterium]
MAMRRVEGYAVRGRCPGVLRPMPSGDGLVVRLRPRLARFAADKALALCDIATAHSDGRIALTNRANLQLRGVREDRLPALQAALAGLGLLDATPELEGRRNILVAPDWRADDDTVRIALDLMARLADLPPLPGKVGFAIDAGAAPILQGDPADFRIERGAAGGLILRADGRATGCALEMGREADALVRLAWWFAESGGGAAGRMARLDAALPTWAVWNEPPAAPRVRLQPGRHGRDPVLGLAFGQADSRGLARLIRETRAKALRVTPWRLIVLEGARTLPRSLSPDFVTEPDAPVLRAAACAGAPFCPQASVETRTLARRLAPRVSGSLHVSGCAKGCARPGLADWVLTGRQGRFDLVRDGRPGDPPEQSGLTAAAILHRFGAA